MDLDDLEVEGYDFCPGCGDWVLAGKKMCGECARTLSEAADEVIALDVDGTKVMMTPPRRPKPKRYESSKIKTNAHRARDRARTRAWIRLARIYEPMFAALYWEEQVREGLDPLPLPDMDVDPTDMLVRDLDEYRERLRATFTERSSTLSDSAQRDPA
ncbi:MAG: hypothetical protein IPG97_13270 [Microthrixaceae bacterium]|nr:hypothetical protein [Microthrixaceae bacterium]